jgi:hypothetical protein
VTAISAESPSLPRWSAIRAFGLSAVNVRDDSYTNVGLEKCNSVNLLRQVAVNGSGSL